MFILEADQHVARVESKHHGQRGPAFLPMQPGQCLFGIGQRGGEHAAHIAAGWVLLHELDQAGKVGGVLFFVHVFFLDVGKTDGNRPTRSPTMPCTPRLCGCVFMIDYQ